MNLAITRPTTVLAVLTALNVLNFADRFLLQGFAVDLCADLHLSALQFTLLTGFVFTTFYTAIGLVMGALADRVRRPPLVAAGVAAWTLLTAATGRVGSFAQLALVRLFTGVGEATLTPAAIGLLADTQPPRRRAFAAGCYYLGAPVGIGGAFLVAGTLGAAIGWRACFGVVGALGLVLTGAMLAMREPRQGLGANDRDAALVAPTREPLRTTLADAFATLRRERALRLVIAAAVLTIFGQGALVLDQLWLVQERGFAKAHAQQLAGALFLAGGVAGALLGGWAADRAEARRAGGRLRLLAWATLAGVPIAALARVVAPSNPLFVPCLFVGSAMVTLGYGPLFAAVQDLAPARLRSTLTAVAILAMTLVGTSGGNLFVGVLVDRLRAVGVDQPITRASLAGLAPWLLAAPCLFAAARVACDHAADRIANRISDLVADA